jgi:hypothetical protein
MKKILLFLAISTSVFLNSCGDSKSDFNTLSGKVLVNINNVSDSVVFKNRDTSLKEKDITFLVNQTTSEAISSVKSPSTFKAIDTYLYSNEDTTIVSLNFTSSNYYGDSKELGIYCKFIRIGNKFEIINSETISSEKSSDSPKISTDSDELEVMKNNEALIR